MLIGIDWGGSKIEGVVMSHDGEVVHRRRDDTPRGDYDGCLAVIVDLVADFEERVGERLKVGVGFPGSLDPKTGYVKGANSTWLFGHKVHEDLERVLERPVKAENDADLLAASEARDGAGAGYDVVYAVNIGSGAGAGVAVGGRAHSGPNNTAGEWGHNPLPLPRQDELPGPDCYCGKVGCMETWVSSRGFEADHLRRTGKRMDAPDIIAAAHARDPEAIASLDIWIDRVARGLSVVVNTLDPDVFVFGGGMSNVDELLERLPEAIGSYTFSTAFYTPIVRSIHGDSSGVRGAAWLWDEGA